MVAAAAVPGNRGSRGVALVLRRGEGRVGNVSELRGKTLGESRAREGARSGRPARHGVAVAPRHPFSMCAQGAVPRGEAERFGWVRFGRTQVWGGGWAGEGGAGVRPTASGRPDRNRGGEGEQREREREKFDSKIRIFLKDSF